MVKATLKMCLCIAVLTSVSTFSHAENNGGVIHFRGAIVEEGCGLSSRQKKVSITCNNNGKPVTHTLSLSALNSYSVHSDSLIQTDIRYLDPQKKLAIVSVTYQ